MHLQNCNFFCWRYKCFFDNVIWTRDSIIMSIIYSYIWIPIPNGQTSSIISTIITMNVPNQHLKKISHAAIAVNNKTFSPAINHDFNFSDLKPEQRALVQTKARAHTSAREENYPAQALPYYPMQATLKNARRTAARWKKCLIRSKKIRRTRG